MIDVEVKLVGMSSDIDFDSGDSLEFLILSINDMRFRAMITEETAARIKRVVGLEVAAAAPKVPDRTVALNVGTDFMRVANADNHMNLVADAPDDAVDELEDGAQVD